MSKYGTRKCKHCQKEFDKRAPIDTYCSIKCNRDAKAQRDAKKLNKKPQPRIKPVSDKRKKQNSAYLLARKIFLMEDDNKYCPVNGSLATEIHHTNGRSNERLLDREFWIGVSREGHQWIHANPEEARKNGWLI
jgi:hypothetical protein